MTGRRRPREYASSVDAAGANNTCIHADSRNMVFDPNGNLLEMDDGGIYRLTNPNGAPAPQPARRWDTVGGNLKAIQFPFTPPYVLDAVDPTRLPLGTNNLYESTNRGDALTRPNGTTDMGSISALAYGGRLNGAANPDVAYVGSGGFFDQQGRLFLRTTAGGPFNALAAYTGGTPRGIALDPDNWQRAYVVDNQGKVWRTVDAGATFTDITGNLGGLTPATPRSAAPSAASPSR
jgi:hypothetical protein